MSIRRFRSAIAAAALMGGTVALGTPAIAQGTHHAATYAPITVAEVEAAQQAWGQALVAIATEHDTNGHAAATRLAGQIIDSAYAYNMGPVLFKPTLTVEPQTFRTTRDGALAYFVGGNSAYPDSGFALRGWRSFRVENAGIVITGNSAMSMGKVHMFDANGNETVVDKTWGYVRDGEGNLRIVLHHSSLPYSN